MRPVPRSTSAVALKPGCYLGAKGPAAEPGPQGSPCASTAARSSPMTDNTWTHRLDDSVRSVAFKSNTPKMGEPVLLAGVHVALGLQAPVGQLRCPAAGSWKAGGAAARETQNQLSQRNALPWLPVFN